jgi:hypothetical protein
LGGWHHNSGWEEPIEEWSTSSRVLELPLEFLPELSKELTIFGR